MINRFRCKSGMMSRLAVLLFSTTSLCLYTHAQVDVSGVDPVPAPGFTGVSLRVLNSTIPPGGTFQFQLLLTEPKPIGHGSTTTTGTGTTSGISLNDPLGQTAGAAVLTGANPRINFTSPLATFGANPIIDYPILTIRSTIPSDMPVGVQIPLSIDITNSFWFDASGLLYPQEIAPGKLTIGGTMAISDVMPGGGFQPAGAVVAILGMGFIADSRVAIEGENLAAANIQFVSANEIDVTLTSGLQMDGSRVVVKNPDQTSTFFPYFHAQVIGRSVNPLLAQTYPLFARQSYTTATLAWNRSGSQFTGIALQNQAAAPATVTLETHSTTGSLLDSVTLSLPGGSKITRDLLEFFPAAAADAVIVALKSDTPVQVLGLLGDIGTGDVLPVMVTAQ